MHANTDRRPPSILSRVLLLLVFALIGCPKEPLSVAYVLRHAEKDTMPANDPPLTAVGQAHAQALAQMLGGQPIEAVFATDYLRTQQTVEPLATQLGLTVQIYNSTAEVVQTVKTSYEGKAVVIAGHSNTVPQIISGFGVTPPADIAQGIPEDEFDHLYMLLISSEGAGVLEMTYWHNLLFASTGIDVRFSESTADVRNNVLFGTIRERDGGSVTAGKLPWKLCLGRD